MKIPQGAAGVAPSPCLTFPLWRTCKKESAVAAPAEAQRKQGLPQKEFSGRQQDKIRIRSGTGFLHPFRCLREGCSECELKLS